MTLYVVDEHSPVRYHIQGADTDSEDDIDEELITNLKTAAAFQEILSNNANVLELEIKFKNTFQRTIPTMKQVISANHVFYDNVKKKLRCEFQPKQTIYFAFNHQARYSTATLFLRGPLVQNNRIALDRVTTYLGTSSDPEYNISSQALRFRADIKKIDDEMKRLLEDKNPPRARRKLEFPMAFPSPSEQQILEAYVIGDEIKWGGIFYIQKAMFEIPIVEAEAVLPG